ncbi:peripherin-2-like isoform X2 [Gordionus sp. m RMFG-2023]|uniref:peripherin-2-like isoform X2 n=1 Tax=Gordionus sp. m RMFG-2023 TaxID=3053472 RepID=UPI0031FC42BA
MKGYLGIKFTERRRKICCAFLLWIYSKCLFSSVINMASGAYLWAELHHHSKLLPIFKDDTVTVTILLVSLLGVLINIIKIKVVFDYHFPYSRLAWVKHINWIMTIDWLLTYALLGLGSLCLVIKKNLKENVDLELAAAMHKYRYDIERKIEIDRIHISFRCCGRYSYADWFNVTWLEHKEDVFKIVFVEAVESNPERDLLAKTHKMIDNVPWSCCDPKSPRPCIHFGVHHNNLHYNYDYRVKTTLYDKGCVEPIYTYFGEYFMQYFAISTYIISTIEGLALFLLMYVKSSIFESIKNEDLLADSYGYFIGGVTLFKDIKQKHETLMKMKEKDINAMNDPDNLKAEMAYQKWRRVSQVLADRVLSPLNKIKKDSFELSKTKMGTGHKKDLNSEMNRKVLKS